MARQLFFGMISLLVMAAADIASAQTPLLMRKIAKNDGVTPTFIGGLPAVPADWPATRWFGQSCTSTIIGSRTVVTAAHCIGNGQSAAIELDNGTVSVVCNHHPAYRSNSSADVALCLADDDLVARGLKYESVNADPSRLQVGTPVTLLGFGCTELGGPPGALYVGTFKITQLPSGNDYRYFLSGGGVKCSGESGGAGYLNVAGGRLVAGTHKDGDQQSAALVETAVPQVIDFYRNWADMNSTQICGVNADATNCR
jgi:Trypsin